MDLKSSARNCDMALLKKFKLEELCYSTSSRNDLIKGKQIQNYREGLYPAFSATGQDIWRDDYEHDGEAIIVSAVGARCGKCFRAKGKWTAIANTHIIFAKENVSTDFLFYYLNNEHFWERGGVAQPFVKIKDSLRRKTISMPVNDHGELDINEQYRIVDLLKEAEQLQKKRAIADQKMEEVIPALFNEMFGNTSDYTQKRLRDGIAQFKYGTSTRCSYDNKFTPILRIPNVLGDQINFDDLKYGELSPDEKEKLLLKEGDILFVRTNGNPDYVGRCAIFGSHGEYAYASYLIRARIDKNILNPWYLTAFLRTKQGREVMRPVIRTTAGQSNINTEGLGNLTIPLPPIELQNKFAEKVNKILELKTKQKESATEINNLFTSLTNSLIK